MSRLLGVACLVVGLGLAIGFGALAIDSLLDYRAFPAAPTPVTVAQLAATKTVARGRWVKLVDAEPDCGRGYARPHETPYALIGDGRTPAVVIAEVGDDGGSAVPCADLHRHDLAGVPSVRSTVATEHGTSLPDGLAWPGVDWEKWPEHRAVVLWTRSGPRNSWIGIWVGAGLAVLGAFVSWYGLVLLRPRNGDAIVSHGREFPSTVQLSQVAARRALRNGWIAICLGLAWGGIFAVLLPRESAGQIVVAALLVGFGLLCGLVGVAFLLQAGRLGEQRMPASVVWLEVRRSYAVTARGLATGVTAYELELPASVAPLEARAPRVITVHSSPVGAGLIFRDEGRAQVAAARTAGSEEFVVIRSDLAELKLDDETRRVLVTRTIRRS